ncbi:class I SAM-dependent methyltransferase [Bacillus sp. NPDC094106]|uniref:class I SAM-dependent methyltransferase n=1 Tax=Bacillus sp. NPDC094106 TaxID=3363949 RepID=UPI0038278F08
MGMELVLREWMEREKDYSISYGTYMNHALYDEGYGYYMKNREKIGRKGDFFTSSNVSSVFARTFAHFFIHLVQNGEVAPNICEIGGGTGRFAYDVLREWKQLSPETFTDLRYSIIELSPFHRKLQNNQLGSFLNISQHESYKELGDSFTGIVFSNELFDAFPVEVIEKRNDILYEVRVTYTAEGKLTEVLRPLEERLRGYLRRHHIQLFEGQRFEVPIAMENYVQEVARWLKEGLFITADYGYTKAEWMHPAHREGSLRGYYNHRLIRNPLEHSGEMDITAHVHWDELKETGEMQGLDTVWHTKQNEFLLAAGILKQLASHQNPDPFSEKQKINRAIRSMILNGGMGDVFDVVIQKKGMQFLNLKRYLSI